MSQIDSNEITRRIMVVDDDPDTRMVLDEILRPEGYDVECLEGGEACLRRAAAAPPDVLILDILMPGINGGQVAKALKANPRTATIPIIFLTGLTDKKIRKAALFELGVEFFLVKPIDPDEIIDKVHEAIRYKTDPEIRG